MQCEVLWSAEQAEDTVDGTACSMFSVRKPRFDVEEEYDHLSHEEAMRFHDVEADVQFHSDGRVTVKRKTNEPPDLNDDLGPVRHRTVKFI